MSSARTTLTIEKALCKSVQNGIESVLLQKTMKVTESKLPSSASPTGKIKIVGRYSSFITHGRICCNLDSRNLWHDSFYHEQTCQTSNTSSIQLGSASMTQQDQIRLTNTKQIYTMGYLLPTWQYCCRRRCQITHASPATNVHHNGDKNRVLFVQ